MPSEEHATPPGNPSASSPAPAIPDHEFLRLIGRGSYGEVWLARNAVGTPRAVKIVRRDRFEHAADFEREFKGLQCFEPVSRTHEGLSVILSLGRLPGAEGFFYVMELADDVSASSSLSADEVHPVQITSAQTISKSDQSSLDTYFPLTLRAALRAHRVIPFQRLLDLGLKLTAAVAHLHVKGLVHRDIKPSNILFVAGQPKLADAGLVTAVDDARSLVGTAGYIAPEGSGSAKADLFALGKVLYEAAFGKDRQDFPQLPPDLRMRTDHAALLEFNAILLKACATDPRERYPSAEAMHADLELLRAGRSVKRRQVWRRVQTLATKLAGACAGLAVVVAVVYLFVLPRPHPADFKPSPVRQANMEYHLGMTELHDANGDKAIEHFEKAAQLDTNFAPAYAQLAEAWLTMGGGRASVTNAFNASIRAVELDPNLGAAHAFFAHGKMFIDLDWSEADKQIRLAVKLGPDSEEVLLASALMLATLGHTNDALLNLGKALELGENTPSKLRVIYSGFIYNWCRQYDRAIEVLDLETRNWGHGIFDDDQMARAFQSKGDYTNSMRSARMTALERGEDAKEVNVEFDTLEKTYQEGGPEKYWRQRLEFEAPKRSESHWMDMAAIHARLNQRPEAFECLRRAREETPMEFAAYIMVDPSLDNLRADKEFQSMLNELWRKK